MKMRDSLLILLCLAFPFLSKAQEPVKQKQKEIGFVFSNLNNFGLTFKTGSDKALWRFNTLLASGENTISTSVSDSIDMNFNSIGFGVTVGREYRKIIATNLELRMGADLSFSYFQSKSEYDDLSILDEDRKSESTTYQPGINLVFGFNYVIKENIVLGVELLPRINYTSTKTVEKNPHYSDQEEIKRETSGFIYGFTNQAAMLSVAFRF